MQHILRLKCKKAIAAGLRPRHRYAAHSVPQTHWLNLGEGWGREGLREREEEEGTEKGGIWGRMGLGREGSREKELGGERENERIKENGWRAEEGRVEW